MVTNSTMQEKGLTSSQQSRNMFSGQSFSQEVQRPKPGEPGWLVSIADCLEEGGMDRMKHQVKDKREKPKPSYQQSRDMFSFQSSNQNVQRPLSSQDSGKGKIIPSQACKTSNSQVSSSQSSVSSAFELLASEEVTSQVILYKEEVAKQSQASQQDMVEDLASGDTVAGEVFMADEVDLPEDNTNTVSDANTPSAAPDSLPPLLTTSQSTLQIMSSSSQLSNMLEQILSDKKRKAKNTTAVDTISKAIPFNMQQEKNIPSLDIMSVPCTQTEDSSTQDEVPGKWKYLAVKDPSLVEDKWECKDNPDQRYGECGAPEQWWDQGLRNKFVENRFMVGSLVGMGMQSCITISSPGTSSCGGQPAVAMLDEQMLVEKAEAQENVPDNNSTEDYVHQKIIHSIDEAEPEPVEQYDTSDDSEDSSPISHSFLKFKEQTDEKEVKLDSDWLRNFEDAINGDKAVEASQRLASPPVNQTATNSILLSSEEEDKVSTSTQLTSSTPISSSNLFTHTSHSSSTPSSSCSSRFNQTAVTESVKADSNPPTVKAQTNKTNADKSSDDIPAASKMTEVSANHWRRSGWSKGFGLKGGGGAGGDKKKTSKPSGIKACVPKVRECNPAPACLVDDHVQGGSQDVAARNEPGNVRGRSVIKTGDHQCKCGKTFRHQRSLSRHFDDCPLNENNPFSAPQPPFNAPSPRKRTSKRTIVNSPLTPHTSGAKLGKEDPKNNSSNDTTDDNTVFEVFEEDDLAVKLLSSKYKDAFNFHELNYNFLNFQLFLTSLLVFSLL